MAGNVFPPDAPAIIETPNSVEILVDDVHIVAVVGDMVHIVYSLRKPDLICGGTQTVSPATIITPLSGYHRLLKRLLIRTGPRLVHAATS